MSTLRERLRTALDGPPKRTQAALAKACGIKAPSVNDWLSGKTQTIEGQNLLKASAFLGVSPKWLATGAGPQNAPLGAAPPGDNRLPIRRALFKLSAGVSGYEVECENGESEPIFMGKRWFEQNHYRADKLLALKVNGRSMEPSLHDGDLVIVNTEDVALRDGEVFAANFDGELVIKRLKRDASQWYLASDNQDKIRSSDKLCDEGCGLIGRIVYKQSEHI